MLPPEPSFPQFGTFTPQKLPLINDFGRGLLVHMEEIDHLHEEFVDLVNALGDATDDQFPPLFQQLVSHTEGHFDFENVIMRRTKYPDTSCHKGEHDRVLDEMAALNVKVQEGALDDARSYLCELPSWFRLHVISMDTSLSNYLHKKR